MKLVLITSSYPAHAEDSAAAAGLFVRDCAELLASLGHEVHVITQDKGIQPAKAENVRVHRFPWTGGSTPLAGLSFRNPGHLRSAISWIRGASGTLRSLRNVDHVLAFWAAPAGWIAYRSGLSYSVWCLGSDIWGLGRAPIFSGLIRRILRKAVNCYADGPSLAQEASNLAGLEVHFLASSRILPTPTPIRASPENQQPSFLFIGRYSEVKGCDILLESMANYRAAGGEKQLSMFGGGPMEELIKERASRDDLRDVVTIHGLADRETVTAQLALCDALIIPSRQESIPLVLSDALHSERPVIVSDVGDMGTLVREYKAGIVVESENIDELTQAMLQFSNTYLDGIERLREVFDLKKSVQRILLDVQPPSK